MRVLVCMLLFFTSLYAKSISASSVGSNKEEALRFAMQELASSIAVEIQSLYEQKQVVIDSNISEETLHNIKIKTHSVFLQPNISYQKQGKKQIQATISIDNTSPYRKKLETISKDINALSIGLESEITQRNIKERIYRLEQILSLYKDYMMYEYVMLALNEYEYAKPEKSMQYYEAKYKSIDKDMFEKKVKVEPKTRITTYRYKDGYNDNAALLNAARMLDIDGVYSALENGVNPNAIDSYGKTALMLGIRNYKIAELLINYNADVEWEDNDGLTALIMALDSINLSKGSCRSVEVLLKNKANPNHIAKTSDSDILIPIILWYKNNSSMPNLEGKFWEDQGLYRCDKEALLNLFLHRGADVNMRDSYNRSILSYAILNDNIELVKRLLSMGARVDKKYDMANQNTDAGKTIGIMLGGK